MATALIALAIGSVVAGYIGIPHALGGHNGLGGWLAPAFAANNCGAAVSSGPLAGIAIQNCAPGEEPALASMTQTATEVPVTASTERAAQPEEHGGASSRAGEDETALELSLMSVSSAIAVLGIGIAFFLWVKNRRIPDQMAISMAPVHNLLLNKYYVDEIYDAAVVQPIKAFSTQGLWKVMDVRVVDGVVNGAGYLVGAFAAGLRLLQTGSVKSYAAGTIFGAVSILAYYLWR
jgi:NADH-quinone oxidoreductase subunit L